MSKTSKPNPFPLAEAAILEIFRRQVAVVSSTLEVDLLARQEVISQREHALRQRELTQEKAQAEHQAFMVNERQSWEGKQRSESNRLETLAAKLRVKEDDLIAREQAVEVKHKAAEGRFEAAYAKEQAILKKIEDLGELEASARRGLESIQ